MLSGMNQVKYIDLKSFTVVLTSHFLDRMDERGNLSGDAKLSNRLFKKIWKTGEDCGAFYFDFGNGQCVCEKVWDSKRKKAKLVFISFVPSGKYPRKNAKRICF